MKKLQKAYNLMDDKSLVVFEILSMGYGLPLERLRSAEQLLLDKHFGDPKCCNTSLLAVGASSPTISANASARAKAMWQDPEMRKILSWKLSRRVLTEESRAKMRNAHTGAMNANARKVTLFIGGETYEIGSISEAAKKFNVPHHRVCSWLSGKTAWPIEGNKSGDDFPWVVGLTGRYADDVEDYLV